MPKPATIRDVAREADVSLKTVSNVLNGTAPVADVTRARVEEVVQRLGYRPNPAARSLRMGRSGVVALAVPDLARPYFAELADRVLAAARDRRLSVLIEQTNGDAHLETAVLTSPRFDHAQGVILALEHLRAGQVERLRLDAQTSSRPVVVIGASVEIGGVSSLTQPDESGGFAATSYLITCGSRRIAVVGGAPEDVGPGSGRVAGYLRALDAHGLPRDPSLIAQPISGGFADGAAAIAGLVDAGVEFDGVFALSDVLAAGVLAGLREAGIEVPGRVSVVGFDNLDLSTYTTPPLTTVDTRIGSIATRAVQLVAARRDGGDDAEHGELGFSLVVRDSTGPIEPGPASRSQSGIAMTGFVRDA